MAYKYHGRVVTYQTSDPSDTPLNISPSQEIEMKAAGVWPRGRHGGHYTNVSHGLNSAPPTFSEAEIARICGGEHAIVDVLDRRAHPEEY